MKHVKFAKDCAPLCEGMRLQLCKKILFVPIVRCSVWLNYTIAVDLDLGSHAAQS